MRLRSLLFVAATLVLACKTSASDSAVPAMPTPPIASASASSEPMMHGHPPNLPPAGTQVRVLFDGKQSDVTLADVPHDGGSMTIAQIWSAAMPGVDAAPLHFDFVGSDGFRPGSRPACTRPLTSKELAAARIDVASHNVTYEGVELAGCYRVRALVRIEATR